MSKFLITGGAGFIGSNIAEHLTKRGDFVRVLDNFYSSKAENLQFAYGLGKDKFELIRGDITNPQNCQEACQGMDYVLHLAALRSVPESMKHPLEYNRVNINGLVNMLQAAAHAKIKRFVFASSSAVYGDAKEFPQQEEHLPRPISPYALNKLAGEHYCQIFAHSFGLETVALRYFNIFGPKQALDDEYAVVIPKFIHCLVNNQPTPIFGNGEQSRDFTYIDNVVLANILAATTPGLKHEVFNVASGIENTVLNLALTLNKVLNKNIQPQFLPLRTGDLFRSTADISKITKAAGYKPTVGFEEGLKKTVEYFKTKWA